jgi:hypothetical protein
MAKTLFDHLNAIYADQSVDYFDTLEDADKKSYSAYMINRLISMNPSYAQVANEFQLYLNTITPRESYLFYSQIVPKGKQFNKYIKSQKKETYDEWVVALVKRHYDVSLREATDYLRIYFASDAGKANLQRLLEMYGTDPKKIKKVFS